MKRLAIALALALVPVSIDASWAWYTVTAYSHGCIRPKSGVERGPQKAANGKMPVPNWSVAADPSLPFDTVLELSYQGIVTTRIVHDRGRDIKKNRLDLFVSDCERARMWGVRRVWVREIRRPLGS